MIRIHNTMTRKKEEFVPLEDKKVRMYVCGVTVYDYVHMGHARAAVIYDVIVRWLRHRGYDVTYITNFTDVDDKIIARAIEEGVHPLELSARYIREYFRDMDAIRVKRADYYPKASETIDDMIKVISGLIEKGYAYESSGNVYFSVEKVENYGKLSGQSLEDMVAGARIEPDENKRNPMDFALWKAAKPGEVSWDSPWGKGRPGWHIECSTMCLKYLGETIDIHGGGTDLIFPHHENEILQSEAYTGHQFVRYWIHNGMLNVNEEKMSKSLKNFFRVRDVLADFSPEAVRFFLLNTHYRKPISYSDFAVAEADKSLSRLIKTIKSLENALRSSSLKGTEDAEELCQQAEKRFAEAMDDDFNTREAIAALFDLSREANRLLNSGDLSHNGAERIIGTFRSLDEILSILPENLSGTEGDDTVEKLMELLISLREEARKKKDWATADRIRDALKETGIVIEDSKNGPIWKWL